MAISEQAGNLQEKIHKLFKEGNDYISPSFRDFDPQTGKKRQEMLKAIVKEVENNLPQRSANRPRLTASQLDNERKKMVQCAISFTQNAIDENKEHSRLAKTAFAIFLTHDKAAQQLGLFPPQLKGHSGFQIEPSTNVSEAMQYWNVKLKSVVKPSPSTSPTPVQTSNPATADTLSGVDTLRYWRDDYDLNDHHHHWHSVYPWSGIVKQDGEGNYEKDKKGDYILEKSIDRQGEIFLYMHSQMLARYNAERLSWNSLGLVDPWTYDQLVEPGYTPPPSLRDRFGARPPLQGWLETSPSSLPDADGYKATTTNMTMWRNNINKAISDGYFVTKKLHDGSSGKFHLTEDNTMNWVGIVVEGLIDKLQEVRENSGEFIDQDLYGPGLHNYGHDKFSMIGYQEYTGPTNRLGVMGFTESAVRDPVFWIWHRHIDEFRQSITKKYKHDLKEFAPNNVKLLSIKILPNSDTTSTPSGGVTTYLTAPQLDLHEVNAKLQHEPYKWEIEVETQDDIKGNSPQFTVRIFIAPKDLMHQQHRWIEMDKFKHPDPLSEKKDKFKRPLSKKKETIIRLDTDSSVARKPDEEWEDPRCLCGWPQNMMLPNGTAKGMDYIAFAMLTSKDELSDDTTHSVSFCGARDHKYPDKRGMGYPFDKLWFDSSAEFYKKIEGLDNVKLYDFKIYSETKLYQGKEVVTDATWENTIKNYFNEEDKKKFIDPKEDYGCIDLAKKEEVINYRMFIFAEFENPKKKFGKIWNDKEKDTFIGWIQAGYP